MNFQQAEAWLDQLLMFKIKLGLEPTRALLAELGNPQDRLRIIHLAGTNGKGSVGATLLSILSTAGIRTGLFSSPHLSSVRERFRLGGRFIAETEFTALVTRLAALLANRLQPTYFEFVTILALVWFAEQQAEAMILETGMGGRLDATNVVTPLLSIITDISRDHEQYLGTDLAAIAGEKAGIIKPGVPVVSSGRCAQAVPVIEARCRSLACPLFLFGRDFSGELTDEGRLRYHALAGNRSIDLPLALRGRHQVINTSLALAALEVLSPVFPIAPETLAQGLRQVRWPGRMELIPISFRGKTVRFLLDGAHNEAGVAALQATLRDDFPRRRLLFVWGNMADKHLGDAFIELMSLVDAIVFTRVAFSRAALPADLVGRLPLPLRPKARCIDDVALALAAVQDEAHPEDLICVSGSLFLVGRVRQLLLGEVVP